VGYAARTTDQYTPRDDDPHNHLLKTLRPEEAHCRACRCALRESYAFEHISLARDYLLGSMRDVDALAPYANLECVDAYLSWAGNL